MIRGGIAQAEAMIGIPAKIKPRHVRSDEFLAQRRMFGSSGTHTTRLDCIHMRPTKSRSRNKSNRNRTVGNVVNRVFESSGPEGKVRGTPQQIFDKYNQLARDAQLSGDRVASENFQQHAEHYQRMLNEAQREQEMRREEHERQNRDRQHDRDRGQGGGNGGQGERSADPARDPQPDAFAPVTGEESDLVETPESRSAARSEEPQDAAQPRKTVRKPRAPKPRPEEGNGNGNGNNGNGNGNDGGPDQSSGPVEAAG